MQLRGAGHSQHPVLYDSRYPGGLIDAAICSFNLEHPKQYQVKLFRLQQIPE